MTPLSDRELAMLQVSVPGTDVPRRPCGCRAEDPKRRGPRATRGAHQASCPLRGTRAVEARREAFRRKAHGRLSQEATALRHALGVEGAEAIAVMRAEPEVPLSCPADNATVYTEDEIRERAVAWAATVEPYRCDVCGWWHFRRRRRERGAR